MADVGLDAVVLDAGSTLIGMDVGLLAARAVHVGDLYAVDVVGARRGGIRGVLLDPQGDCPTGDCEVHRDLAAFTHTLLGRGAPSGCRA